MTDPSNVTAASSIGDDGTLELDGAWGITTFESGDRAYAAVAAYSDDGVQILDITDPSDITAVHSIGDDGTLALDDVSGITTFKSGSSTYAAVTSSVDDGVQIIDITDPSDITAADSINDDNTLVLDDPRGITTFESGGSTYAAVASSADDGVQILDITDPLVITAADSIDDDGTLELDGAWGIATFESGDRTYAAVTAYTDDGVQIIDITDPSDITAADSITNTATLKLNGPRGIATFKSGGSTYAAVASSQDDGVQILDITDPSAITAADSITAALELDGAWGITTFESGGSTYAAVASSVDDGVQILDITDPSNVTAADSIGDDGTLELDNPLGIATFKSGGSTYAAVTSSVDDGVQIIDITDPSDITAADSINDDNTLVLDDPRGITTFKSGGSTYAAVTSFGEDGVQILDITDPSAITAADSITAALELDGAWGITTFESGGSTYAAVASSVEDGVQILDITDPSAITAADSIGDDGTLVLNDPRGITTFESGGSTYAAVAAPGDDGVQILDITDPSNVTAADSIDDDGTLVLDGPRGITTFESGGSTYAAVTSFVEDGIQILDITDPSNVTAADSIGDDGTLVLDGAWGITTFKSGGSTYAAVTAAFDNGVQILRLADNIPPAVEAGADQEVAEGTTVTLSGTATDADTGDTLTYSWTHDSALPVTIAGSDSASASFTAPNVADNTTITVTLTVNDGIVDVSDTLQVNITDSPNSPPEVEAGDDQEVAEGAAVSLSGTATDDDPEDTLTYSWTHDGALPVTITGSDSLSASFTAPNVAANTTITVTLTVNDGTVDASDTLQVNITDSPNSPPEVGAGADQEVAEGAVVSLSGTATDDDPEDTLTYSWTHDGALPVTITGSDSASASFTAPNVAANTTITVTLTVNDGTVDVSDTLQVNITDSPNSPPEVGAGADQEVAEGAVVSLSGTATDDDPEDTLTYSWTHDGALPVTIAGSDSASASFTAPGVAANTTITVTLTVNDGTVDASDTLQVNITDVNIPPTVNAGQNQRVAEGTRVTLSGTATDADTGDTLTYSWTHDSALSITITGSDSASASFTAPNVSKDTPVEFTLGVSDGTALVFDRVIITIQDSANTPPRANAGPDQNKAEGSTVNLDGTGSDADPEDTLAYSWLHRSALTITFDARAEDPSFTAPNVSEDTRVEFVLGVSDGTASVFDKVIITIQDSANTPPTVNAGQNQEVAEGAAVSLSGTATDVDPEDTLTYEWTHDDTLAITITGSDSASASFTAPGVAANTTVTVTLTVNDGTVDASDTLQVTITDSPNSPPEVEAGADQEVAEGATVSLSGTATDGDTPGRTTVDPSASLVYGDHRHLDSKHGTRRTRGPTR